MSSAASIVVETTARRNTHVRGVGAFVVAPLQTITTVVHCSIALAPRVPEKNLHVQELSRKPSLFEGRSSLVCVACAACAGYHQDYKHRSFCISFANAHAQQDSGPENPVKKSGYLCVDGKLRVPPIPLLSSTFYGTFNPSPWSGNEPAVSRYDPILPRPSLVCTCLTY